MGVKADGQHLGVSDQPKTIADRFDVIAPLGEGGAARIFKVVDRSTSAELALKLLNRQASGPLRGHFELEYQTLLDLQHPHTVQVHEFGHDTTGLFYTMELLHGSDLSGSAPLPWQTACKYVRDASQVLALLHARQLIHRDVSPRNLWCTTAGQVKLIDFGALAHFGKHPHVIGTPPFVPPESLEQQPLDQRTDLYALGAVFYYLLTGIQAYPARTLGQLPLLWQVELRPPSEVREREEASELPAIPAELDQLVLSLLRADPATRPSSAADVIDRIDTLLGQELPSDVGAASLRISNPAFVGQERALRTLRRQLALAYGGRSQASVIVGPTGVGRSRLLHEFGRRARVEESTVIQVQAEHNAGSYALASRIGIALVQAAPSRARAAADRYVRDLALDPRLRSWLSIAPTVLPTVAHEHRVRLQRALCSWINDFSVGGPLVMLVDGLEHADDESVACLHSLTQQRSAASKWLLACTFHKLPDQRATAAQRALLRGARRIELSPLPVHEFGTLLSSVFGSAEHLSRLTARLYKATGGNPGHALELCRKQLSAGNITFINATWVLPRDLNDEALSSTRDQALLNRLQELSPAARRLCRAISIQAGPIPIALLPKMAECSTTAVGEALEQLIKHNIVHQQGIDVTFVHEPLRAHCASELSDAATKRARAMVAEHVLRSPEADTFARTQAGLHLFACGNPRGPEIIVQAALHAALDNVDALPATAPLFEQALMLFRERGRRKEEQLVLLAALSRAGFVANPHYHLEYAEEAVQGLAEALCMPLFYRLRRRFGGRISLAIALSKAGAHLFASRHDPCVPTLPQAVQLLVMSATMSSAARTVLFDADKAQYFADVLAPFAVLGPRSLASFMYELSCAAADTARDRQYATCARFEVLLSRLHRPLASAHEQLIQTTRAGALLAMASLQTMRDDTSALLAVNQLERINYSLSRAYAAQVRAMYYATHGYLKEFEKARDEVEQFAIAHGTSWQFEVWISGPMGIVAMLLHDAMMMKLAREHFKRMSVTTPSLRSHARQMHGAHLLLRGRYAESIPWLMECLQDEPGSRIACAFWHGALARAYNRLGQAQRAYETCMRIVSSTDQRDFSFPAMKLIILTELSIAEAALSRGPRAKARIAELLAHFAPHQNPLTLGRLHETALEIALLEADVENANAHLAQMYRHYNAVESPSLRQRSTTLEMAVLALSEGPRMTVPRNSNAPFGDRSEEPASLLLSLINTSDQRTDTELAQDVMRALAGHAHASRAWLFSAHDDADVELVINLDKATPSAVVVGWVRSRVAEEFEDLATATHFGAAEGDLGSNLVLHVDEWWYVFLPIYPPAQRPAEQRLFVVLGSQTGKPELPGKLLPLVADYLYH